MYTCMGCFLFFFFSFFLIKQPGNRFQTCSTKSICSVGENAPFGVREHGVGAIKAIWMDDECDGDLRAIGKLITEDTATLLSKEVRWLSGQMLSQFSYLLRSILAKSELDRDLGSPAVFATTAAVLDAVPFSTLLPGAVPRCSERGSRDTCVRPLPLAP